jgi:hypothetical protein
MVKKLPEEPKRDLDIIESLGSSMEDERILVANWSRKEQEVDVCGKGKQIKE